MAERELATFGFLSLAITSITIFVIQIYPHLYPQMIGLGGPPVSPNIRREISGDVIGVDVAARRRCRDPTDRSDDALDSKDRVNSPT